MGLDGLAIQRHVGEHALEVAGEHHKKTKTSSKFIHVFQTTKVMMFSIIWIKQPAVAGLQSGVHNDPMHSQCATFC